MRSVLVLLGVLILALALFLWYGALTGSGFNRSSAFAVCSMVTAMGGGVLWIAVRRHDPR